MWQDEELFTHINTENSLQAKSIVHLEWNLNDPFTIERVGNYRTGKYEDGRSPANVYDPYDLAYNYTNATYADTAIVEDLADVSAENIPVEYVPDGYDKLFFSLDDCTGKNRPRSGINKAVYLPGRKIPPNNYTENTPRYYLADRNDSFKYWTSRRMENGKERGISYQYTDNGIVRYMIEDACPFVVYENEMFTNVITIKMQTHADEDADPGTFFAQKQIPKNMAVQVLKGDYWETILMVTESDIDYSGNIDLRYGLINEGYYVGTSKPEVAYIDDIYIDGSFVYRYDGSEWSAEQAQYGWKVVPDGWNQYPTYDETYRAAYDESYRFVSGATDVNRHFDTIRGVRLYVIDMVGGEQTFDLIEISPRVRIDVSEIVRSYQVDRSLANVSETSLPIGQLLAGNGSVELFDDKSMFSSSDNPIGQVIETDMKAVFFEGIANVGTVNKTRKFVQLGTMYSESKKPNLFNRPNIQYELRDAYWLFEQKMCPNLLMTDVSLSVAVATLLDSIGFSNYAFIRSDEDKDMMIPFFFVNNQLSIAQALQELARASQSAMFFDEYNNFIVMYKHRVMPYLDESTDFTFYGNTTESARANIIELSSEDKERFNDGSITFSEKTIGRGVYGVDAAGQLPRYNELFYSPSLLWEIQPQQNIQRFNEQNQSFVLFAGALAAPLNDQHPYVENNTVQNNTITINDQIDFLATYSGYLYANGEIIKFDAVEYVVNNEAIWFTSPSDYETALRNANFGSVIYPTGRLRIFAEPYFDEDGVMKNGKELRRSGRAQFNTQITSHSTQGDPAWFNVSNRNSVIQTWDHIFREYDEENDPTVGVTVTFDTNRVGRQNTALAQVHQKIFMVGRDRNDGAKYDGTHMSGLSIQGTTTSKDYVTHITKPLPFSNENHRFGARIRIIGNKKDVTTENGLITQEAIVGGSGGLFFFTNNDKTTGYYFEISSVDLFEDVNNPNADRTQFFNVAFYRTGSPNGQTNRAFCDLLWRGNQFVTADEVMFDAFSRRPTDQYSLVNDLAVEIEYVGNHIKFHLYLNDRYLSTVTEHRIGNGIRESNYGVFIRGNSHILVEHFYRFAVDKAIDPVVSDVFGYQNPSTVSDFKKYALTGIIEQSKLYDTNNIQHGKELYYEEFGTIMRECVYINAKYDQSFPAFTAQIAPTFDKMPVYAVSSFAPTAYSAEFLLFNIADHSVNLNDEYGSFLRINGIAVTTGASREYTVDEFYDEVANAGRPLTDLRNPRLSNINVFRDDRTEIIKDRLRRGKADFNFQSEYIQNIDVAREMMDWLTKTALKEHTLVGIRAFPNPMIQLGDIFTVDHVDTNEVGYVDGKRFVVYNIKYERSPEGPKQTIYGVDI